MTIPQRSTRKRAPVHLRAASLASSCLAASLGWAPALMAGEIETARSEQAETSLEKVTVVGTAISPYTVEDSESSTKLPLSLRETPQSVTVITRERLDDQNLQSLRQVLDNTPGVYSYAYDSERVLFTARGFTIDNLLYDGVPAVTNFNTDSVDETLDTALYDRIEIVRGATGLLSGAGSPSAAVNLVRKHADSKEFAADVDVTAGSWQDWRVQGDVSFPLVSSGAVRARLVGVYQDRNSYQNLYRNKKQVFYGVIDADLADSTRLSLGVDFQDNDPHGNTWGSFPLFLADGSLANWSRSVTTATDWSFWDRRKKTVFAELRHEFSNQWSLRSTLTWRRANENLALFYMYGFPDNDTGEGLQPFAYRSRAEITTRALDLYATGPFELFGRRQELVVGYNGSRVYNRGYEYATGDLADPGNFFHWDGSYPQPQFAAEPVLVNDIHTNQNGFYGALRASFTDSLKLIAGARYATWKTDSYYIYDTSLTNVYSFNKLIPYAGLVYDVAPEFSVFASFTKIFKPQSNRDVSGRYLDPIDGRSAEIGIKGEHFDRRLNTALTVFETRQDNVATAVYDSVTGEPVLLPDGTQASRPIDGTRTRGFEFEASGSLLPGWNASLGWTHYTMQDADGGAIRTFIPRSLVRSFTSWSVPATGGRLTLGGGVNWQSASHTVVGSPLGAATLPQPAVTLLSAMVRVQLTANASVQFNGNNLLDKKYYVLDEFDNTYYGAPASYSLGVNVHF